MSVKRKYGWRPQLPDRRDRPFKLAAPAAVLPSRVDLRPGCSPIEDQGELGSCTAHALTGALEYLEFDQREPVDILSRLFIYYNERVIEGTVDQDAGATLRDGIKTLAQFGVCEESDWPYDPNAVTNQPPPPCYAAGLAHQVSSYEALSTVDDMRSCLASGFPFVAGISVYESFESDAVAASGIAPMPLATETLIGGHAVCCVGYDDATQMFLCRNSWGYSWGQAGYFWIPYAYVGDADLASDFWVVRK